jgi:hypothetical protein
VNRFSQITGSLNSVSHLPHRFTWISSASVRSGRRYTGRSSLMWDTSFADGTASQNSFSYCRCCEQCFDRHAVRWALLDTLSESIIVSPSRRNIQKMFTDLQTISLLSFSECLRIWFRHRVSYYYFLRTPRYDSVTCAQQYIVCLRMSFGTACMSIKPPESVRIASSYLGILEIAILRPAVSSSRLLTIVPIFQGHRSSCGKWASVPDIDTQCWVSAGDSAYTCWVTKSLLHLVSVFALGELVL